MLNSVMEWILWVTYFLSLYFAVFWFIVFLTEEPKVKKKEIKEWPTVTVAIPSYNEEDFLEKTAQSVLELDYPKNKLDIIIVNDGSKDKTLKIANQIALKHKNVRVIDQLNMGKGGALNSALDLSKSEYFVCMDSDSFIESGALKKMLPYFYDETIAAVLPSMKVKGDNKKFLQKVQSYEYIVNMWHKELMGRLDAIRVTPGPFACYKRDVIVQIGKFDANHNLTEDLEIALRLQKHHYKIVQTTDAHVETIPPHTIKGVIQQRNRWYKGSVINSLRYKELLFNKKYGDFAFTEMPTSLLAGLLSLVLIISFFYYLLKPLSELLMNLYNIDFKFWAFFKDFAFNYSLLDINFHMVVVGLFMACASFYVLKRSHILMKEKIFRHGMIPVFFYITVYFFIIGIVWLGIAKDFIFRRKQQKW